MSETALAPRLSTTEQERFGELEAIVARGRATFVEVGTALREIRDKRLYRVTHATFTDYLQERWRVSRSRGYQLIDAAKVAAAMSTTVDTPPNEAQARELVPLLADEQALIEIWQQLKHEHGERLTAELIRAAVERTLAAEQSRLATARSNLLRAERQAEDAAAATGDVVFHHGDCRDLAGMLADASVALLLTDPPYGINYQGRLYFFQEGRIAGDETAEQATELLAAMLALVRSKLAAAAHVLVFTSWRHEPVTRSLLEACDLTIRSSLIWDKGGHGVGDTVHAFGPAHERIVHATSGDARMRYRLGDVFHQPRVKPHQHPTEKPVELLEQLIRATTNPGELVCDPFCGVASTLVAAVQAGRRGWGCELDRDYHAHGSTRLAATRAQPGGSG